MAELSKVNVNSTDYDLKDQKSRYALVDVVNAGAKNKLENTATSATVGEVVFTVNDDGTVTAYTTATTAASRSLQIASSGYVDSTDICTGTPDVAYDINTQFGIGNSGNIKNIEPGEAVTAGVSGNIRYFSIYIRAGVNIPQSNAITFRPMICTKAEWDISQAYVPYGKTNAELTSDISALSTENTRQETEIGVVANAGAKNLLNPDDYIKNSTGGLMITETGTGTYKITGTPSGTVDIFTTQSGKFDMMYGLEAGKTYTISGLPEGNGLLCRIDVSKNNSGSWDAQIISNLTLPQTFTVPSDATGLYIRYRVTTSAMIPSGGISLEPMIRPASITDSTFVPYAKTNVDLTNENANQQLEIDYAINTGVKNILNSVCHDIGEPVSSQGRTLTMLPDGGIKIEGTHTGSANYADFYLMGAWSETKYVMNLSNVPHIASIQAPDLTSNSDKAMIYLHIYDRHTGSTVQSVSPTSNISGSTFNFDPTAIYISVYKNLSIPTGGIVVYPMIRRAEITDATFQQYALSNPVITPAVIKAVDEGAKNLFDIDHLDTGGTYNALYGISNGVLSVTSNGSYGRLSTAFNLPSGTYVMSCNVSNISIAGGTSAIRITLNPSGSNPIVKQEFTSSQSLNLQFTLSAQSKVYIMFYENESSTSYANSADFSNIMICTASDLAVSKKFVPYTLTNRELYEEKIDHDLPVVSGSILDYADTFAPGIYFARQSSSTGSGKPVNNRRYVYNIYVYSSATATIMAIECEDSSNPRMYLTNKVSGTWGSWYKFEGTKVT